MSCGAGVRGGDLGLEDTTDLDTVRDTIPVPKKARQGRGLVTPIRDSEKISPIPSTTIACDSTESCPTTSINSSTHCDVILQQIEQLILASLKSGGLLDIPARFTAIEHKLTFICDMLQWLSEEDSPDAASTSVVDLGLGYPVSLSSQRSPASLAYGEAQQTLLPQIIRGTSTPSMQTPPIRSPMSMPSTQWATVPCSSSIDPRSATPLPFMSRSGIVVPPNLSNVSYAQTRTKPTLATTLPPNHVGNAS